MESNAKDSSNSLKDLELNKIVEFLEKLRQDLVKSQKYKRNKMVEYYETSFLEFLNDEFLHELFKFV